MNLIGKAILVTGASSGIGRVVAHNIADKGANIFLLARNLDRLNETKNSLFNSGNHQIVQCDLTDDNQLSSIVESLPKLDGAVFCAGINDFVPVKFIKKEKIDTMFQTNYFSQLLLIQNIIKKKLLNKKASLVFISSLSSLMGVPGTLLYAASKGAINSSVKVLAAELAPQGIRANAICPGIVRTPMLSGTNITEEQFTEQEKLYPLGLGTPNDVANAVAFHLSDESRWLTGNIMVLDGGFSLQ